MLPNEDTYSQYSQQVQDAQDIRELLQHPGWQLLAKNCVNTQYIDTLNTLINTEESERKFTNDVLRGRLQAINNINQFIYATIEHGEYASTTLQNLANNRQT